MPVNGSNRVAEPETKELLITRIFNAPRETIFTLWTEPHHVVQWWGPKHHPATQMMMDVRPGGKWRACLRSVEDGKELWMNGTFREINKPERIVFTFMWEEEGERGIETLITISFVEVNGKTEMHFHQAPFQSNTERDGHTEGWMNTFDRLEEMIVVGWNRSFE